MAEVIRLEPLTQVSGMFLVKPSGIPKFNEDPVSYYPFTMKFRMAVIFCVLLLCAGCIWPVLGDTEASSGNKVIIGAMPFNEQYILAEIFGKLLENQGYSYEINSGLNNAMLYEGVKNGQIDLYVDYTSAVPTYFESPPAFESLDPDVVTNDVKKMVTGDGVVWGGKVGFRNDYQMAVSQDFAAEKGVSTISDLAPYTGDMVLGSDLVFHLDELYGLPNLQKVYGYTFKEVVPMEPTLLYQAVDLGQVDIIPASSTDARIDLFNLTTLTDDKAALAPYDSILLITGSRGTDKKLMSALEQVMGVIDTETMRSLNRQFDVDKKDAGTIAEEFLADQGLI